MRKVFISQKLNGPAQYGQGSPGPAAPYMRQQAVGKQTLSRMFSEPHITMATKARAKDGLDGGGIVSPGPAYMLPAAVGPQPDSRKGRAATPAFGRSTRATIEKVFCSHEHNKARHGEQSPGPAAQYWTQGAIGNQVGSKYATRPRSAFAVSSRWGQYEAAIRRNATPGPGSYDY